MGMRRKIETIETDKVQQHRAEDKNTHKVLQRQALTKSKEVEQQKFVEHYDQMITEWQKVGMIREQFDQAINNYIKTLNNTPKTEPPGKQIDDFDAKIREIEGKVTAFRNKK